MKYDLHIHTNYSLCSNLAPAIVLKIAKKLKLDGVAIADHNEIKGAFKVKKLNKDKDFEVIVSSEVRTDKGDVLAYYINKQIKSRNLFEVLDEIKAQGGLAVVAHPFRALPHLRFRYPLKELKGKIDGIECLNLRTSLFSNNLASYVCDKHKFAKTAGSDGHFTFEVGRAYTIFDGDLRKAIKKRKTKVAGKSPFGFMGGSLSFLLKTKRKLLNNKSGND